MELIVVENDVVKVHTKFLGITIKLQLYPTVMEAVKHSSRNALLTKEASLQLAREFTVKG